MIIKKIKLYLARLKLQEAKRLDYRILELTRRASKLRRDAYNLENDQ